MSTPPSPSSTPTALPPPQYEGKYTVEPSRTGEYFHGKTKRKATCSAVPGPCTRTGISSTGRDDCAYKCINNTDEVRKALGGNRCLSFNFETDSGFCEVLDRGYWSGQQHGLGKRYAVRKKDEDVQREAPTPTDPNICRVEVYEYANKNHWNATYYDTTKFRDIDKKRIGSVKVENCTAQNKAVLLWNDDKSDGIILTDGSYDELDSYGATNQISQLEIREYPTADTDTHYVYRMNKLTGLDNRFGQENVKRIRETDRKSETIMLAEEYKGDPCLGGELYWEAKDRVNCRYAKDKATLLPALKQLAATIENDQEPAASPRRGLYEDLMEKHCGDPENLLDVIGTNGKRCFDTGSNAERARQFCSLGDNIYTQREEVCTSNNLGLDNYTNLGSAYCKKHPEATWCGCYNVMQQPNKCGAMTSETTVNSDVAGCDLVFEQMKPMLAFTDPDTYRFYLNKKHCDFCATVTGADVFAPKNAQAGCASSINICSIQARQGQATDSDMKNTCQINANAPPPNTGGSTTDIAGVPESQGPAAGNVRRTTGPIPSSTPTTPGSTPTTPGSTPTTPGSTPSPASSGGMSSGAKIGIGIAVCLLLLIVIFMAMKKKR